MNPNRTHILRPAPLLVIAVVTSIMPAGCEPSQRGSNGVEPTPSASPADVPSQVDFPASLRVADESVNKAIDRAIEACFSGDYEAFRLLWSIRQNPPFTEQEFRFALKGGARVTVNRLQKFRTPEREVIYAVAGRVELFQPDIPNPVRDVILLLVKESGQWRLAVAPGYVRKALENMDRSENADEETDLAVTPQPAASDTPAATASPTPTPTRSATPSPEPSPLSSPDSPQP